MYCSLWPSWSLRITSGPGLSDVKESLRRLQSEIIKPSRMGALGTGRCGLGEKDRTIVCGLVAQVYFGPLLRPVGPFLDCESSALVGCFWMHLFPLKSSYGWSHTATLTSSPVVDLLPYSFSNSSSMAFLKQPETPSHQDLCIFCLLCLIHMAHFITSWAYVPRSPSLIGHPEVPIFNGNSLPPPALLLLLTLLCFSPSFM